MNSKIIVIKMPSLSPTMTTGTLTSWVKKVGDKVNIGDVIAEIQTDKAVMEMESPNKGVLRRILVEAGSDDVAVETPIALIADESVPQEAIDNYNTGQVNQVEIDLNRVGGFKRPTADGGISKETATQATSQPTETSGNSAVQISTRIRITPYAKLLAQEQGLDYRSIQGSGRNGFITASDIQALANSAQPQEPSKAPVVPSQEVDHVITVMSPIRKAIARKTQHAMTTIPHFYVTAAVDMTNLLSAKSQLPVKTTVNDWFLMACGRALQKLPMFNCIWEKEGESLRQFSGSNINCAMDVGSGPILPLIRDLHKVGLQHIHQTVKEIVEKAKTKQAIDSDIGGFSISNLGMYNVHHFNAVINHPQVAMLAIGGTDSNKQCLLTLACDHRAVDGKDAAMFLQTLTELLSNPIMLLC